MIALPFALVIGGYFLENPLVLEIGIGIGGYVLCYMVHDGIMAEKSGMVGYFMILFLGGCCLSGNLASERETDQEKMMEWIKQADRAIKKRPSLHEEVVTWETFAETYGVD